MNPVLVCQLQLVIRIQESAQIVNAVIFRVVALNLSSKDVLCKEHLDIFNAIHGTLMPDAEQPLLVFVNDDDFECRPIRPLRPLPLVVILDRCLTMPLRIEEIIFPVSAPIVMAFTDPATCFLVFKKLSDRLLQFLGVSPISGTAQGWHVDTLSPIGLGL